jgi:hypothetical protein
MKIFELILPFALKLIHSWLENSEETKEAKKDWMNFINKMDEAENNSKRLNKVVKDLKGNWID